MSITLVKASELKKHGYNTSYQSYWSYIHIVNSNDSAYLISFKNEVSEELEIEYISKYELSDEYHDEHYDEYQQCVFIDSEYIPLSQFFRM